MPRLVESWIQGAPRVDQLAAFFAHRDDPWDRLHLECAPLAFGAGSHRSFADYFQGASRVVARSLEEVCAWLLACEFHSDQTLFLQDDFWQHPLTFEQLRKGDCEDHALWAWRKLAELQIPARFTAGCWRGVAHAWVLLDHPTGVQVFETTAKSEIMVRPLDTTTRAEYCPALSVDHRFRTYVHAGYPFFCTHREPHPATPRRDNA